MFPWPPPAVATRCGCVYIICGTHEHVYDSRCAKRRKHYLFLLPDGHHGCVLSITRYTTHTDFSKERLHVCRSRMIRRIPIGNVSRATGRKKATLTWPFGSAGHPAQHSPRFGFFLRPRRQPFIPINGSTKVAEGTLPVVHPYGTIAHGDFFGNPEKSS